MKGDVGLKNFVDYKWLKENLDREDLIILDVRDGDENIEGAQLYEEGHIRGAQYVPGNMLVSQVQSHGGRSPLPDLEEFLNNMKSFGIRDDSAVVVYDKGEIAKAGRLWWLLKYIGKDKVYVLDGGYNKWKKEKGEISKERPKVDRSDCLSLNVNQNIRVDMEEVKRKLNNSSTAIVDVRAYERYTGEYEPLDKVGGHIPNALNYPWEKLVEDGEIKPLDQVEEYFRKLRDYDEIIVHCGSGITATVNIMLMEEIGLKPKHYNGGYSDWISYQDNEVVTEE